MDIYSISSAYGATPVKQSTVSKTNNNSFQSVLDGAIGLIKETDQLQHQAEAEEIKFALGEADNTHDMIVAEQKALVALQYTAAIKDGVVDAYKTIMNMQI